MLRFVSSLPLGAAAHSHCCISRHKTHYRLCNTIRLLHLYFVSHGDNPPFVSEEWMSICYNYFPCTRSYFTAVFWSPLLPRNKCGVLSFHRSWFILSDENKRKKRTSQGNGPYKVSFFNSERRNSPPLLPRPLKRQGERELYYRPATVWCGIKKMIGRKGADNILYGVHGVAVLVIKWCGDKHVVVRYSYHQGTTV